MSEENDDIFGDLGSNFLNEENGLGQDDIADIIGFRSPNDSSEPVSVNNIPQPRSVPSELLNSLNFNFDDNSSGYNALDQIMGESGGNQTERPDNRVGNDSEETTRGRVFTYPPVATQQKKKYTNTGLPTIYSESPPTNAVLNTCNKAANEYINPNNPSFKALSISKNPTKNHPNAQQMIKKEQRSFEGDDSNCVGELDQNMSDFKNGFSHPSMATSQDIHSTVLCESPVPMNRFEDTQSMAVNQQICQTYIQPELNGIQDSMQDGELLTLETKSENEDPTEDSNDPENAKKEPRVDYSAIGNTVLSALAREHNLDMKGMQRKNPWGNYSYKEVIRFAIECSPEKKLQLSQIYEWVIKTIPYFKDKTSPTKSGGWKNSIRHNLSLHQEFLKLGNEDGSKQSSWWTMQRLFDDGKIVEDYGREMRGASHGGGGVGVDFRGVDMNMNDARNWRNGQENSGYQGHNRSSPTDSVPSPVFAVKSDITRPVTSTVTKPIDPEKARKVAMEKAKRLQGEPRTSKTAGSKRNSTSTVSLKNQGKRPSFTVFINNEPKSETWKNALLTGKNASASSTETSEDSSMGVENGRRMSLTNISRNSKKTNKNNNNNPENTLQNNPQMQSDVFYSDPPPSIPRHTISYQPGGQPIETAERNYNDTMVNDVMNEVGMGENNGMNDPNGQFSSNGDLRRLDSGYFRQNNEGRSRGNSVTQQAMSASNGVNKSSNNSIMNSVNPSFNASMNNSLTGSLTYQQNPPQQRNQPGLPQQRSFSTTAPSLKSNQKRFPRHERPRTFTMPQPELQEVTPQAQPYYNRNPVHSVNSSTENSRRTSFSTSHHVSPPSFNAPNSNAGNYRNQGFGSQNSQHYGGGQSSHAPQHRPQNQGQNLNGAQNQALQEQRCKISTISPHQQHPQQISPFPAQTLISPSPPQPHFQQQQPPSLPHLPYQQSLNQRPSPHGAHTYPFDNQPVQVLPSINSQQFHIAQQPQNNALFGPQLTGHVQNMHKQSRGSSYYSNDVVPAPNYGKDSMVNVKVQHSGGNQQKFDPLINDCGEDV